MIDTDKYEGHDMHRIIIDKSGANHSYVIYTNKHGGKDSMYVNDTTAELIADAPLLLEEVLRLERELDTQYEYIEWLEEFAPKAGDYNTVWDAYELAKGIHWTQVEEEE